MDGLGQSCSIFHVSAVEIPQFYLLNLTYIPVVSHNQDHGSRFILRAPLDWSKWSLLMQLTTARPDEGDGNYSKTSNISRTLVGNKIFYNSDVVETSPVGAAPTTSSFST